MRLQLFFGNLVTGLAGPVDVQQRAVYVTVDKTVSQPQFFVTPQGLPAWYTKSGNKPNKKTTMNNSGTNTSA